MALPPNVLIFPGRKEGAVQSIDLDEGSHWDKGVSGAPSSRSKGARGINILRPTRRLGIWP